MKERRVPEVALDRRQRDPLMQPLDAVCTAELVWRQPAPDSSTEREMSRFGARRGCGHPRPRSARAAVTRLHGPVRGV